MRPRSQPDGEIDLTKPCDRVTWQRTGSACPRFPWLDVERAGEAQLPELDHSMSTLPDKPHRAYTSLWLSILSQ